MRKPVSKFLTQINSWWRLLFDKVWSNCTNITFLSKW